MLVTNHVLSGAVIGAAVRHPVPAFVVGVASHFALDAVPHWGKFGAKLMRVAVPDGLTGLAMIGAMAAVAVVDDFHQAIQREEPRRAHYEVVAALLFSSIALALLRRRARGVRS